MIAFLTKALKERKAYWAYSRRVQFMMVKEIRKQGCVTASGSREMDVGAQLTFPILFSP